MNSIGTKKNHHKEPIPITCTNKNFEGIELFHNDPMVVKLELAKF